MTITNNYNPKISPDGRQIAYLSNRDGNQEAYVMSLDGSKQTRLTKNRILDGDPAWSPDGSKVFFTSQNVFGIYDIYKVNKDGSSTERILINASRRFSRQLSPKLLSSFFVLLWI